VNKQQYYKIARPEKALFDFLYLNQASFGKNFLLEERFSFSRNFNWQEFRRYIQLIETNSFKRLAERLL
jgi:hypothetical protein